MWSLGGDSGGTCRLNHPNDLFLLVEHDHVAGNLTGF